MATTDAAAATSSRAQPLSALPRLDSLTGLRFFAAWLVLQHHFTNFALIPGLDRFTGFGTTGVTFFFVLSGFVLTWSFQPRDTAPRFYWRRFARIWPLHFVTTLLALPVFYAWRDVPMDWSAVLLSVALLHAWVPTATTYFAGNPASWSLSCEMFFYAVHPLLIRRALRLGLLALGLGAVAIFATLYFVADWSSVLTDRVQGWLLYVSPIFRIAEFFLGMGIALAVKRGFRLPVGVIPAVLLLAAWFVFYYQVAPDYLGTSQVEMVAYLDYAMLPALYGLVIIGAVQVDLAGAPSLLRSRLMVLLGQWSYALYLIHATVIYALIEWIGPRSTSVVNVAWLGVVSVVCLAISAALYHGLEHPVEQYLRGLQRRPPAPAPAEVRSESLPGLTPGS